MEMITLLRDPVQFYFSYIETENQDNPNKANKYKVWQLKLYVKK